ncbi:hypothetical protein [Georgenia sp. SYP-B2076]|uniref:hypothetical protein n=1 Tax=Georgenia sp. SYP-B2076 TaxID=2495881 RepID=UPI000F8ECD0F|nr:hypothetical protein [Georgenia sp. SYP-B2076]
MNVVAQVFAGLTAVMLLVVGVLEIACHGDQRLHSIFLIRPQDVRAVGGQRRRLQPVLRRGSEHRLSLSALGESIPPAIALAAMLLT